MGHTPYDRNIQFRYIVKLIGIIWLCVYRLSQIFAHLILIDIKGGHEVDITDMITSQVNMHQARYELIRIRFFIVINTLY